MHFREARTTQVLNMNTRDFVHVQIYFAFNKETLIFFGSIILNWQTAANFKPAQRRTVFKRVTATLTGRHNRHFTMREIKFIYSSRNFKC